MNHVLLTGASGLVGVEVLSQLIARGDAVSAVVHRNSKFVANDGKPVSGAAVVHGNVRAASFGVLAEELAELGKSVTCVVHCAATTDFGARQIEYDELNVAGTEHAIALAREWTVPLIYVSTAYVCGTRNGTILESDLDAGQTFGNAYEASKFRAEQLLRAAAASGLRTCIVRPGIVTGRAIDGAIREHKNLYTVVKLIVEGKLRSLPGRYDATLSLVPVDYVADVIVGAVVDFDRAVGKTFHAVGNETISLREISDVLAEYPSFEVAKYVPSSTFSVDDLDRNEREYYQRIGVLYESYFDRRPSFDTTNTRELMGAAPPATGKDYLRTLLDHCLDTGYLGIPLPSIDDVLRRIGATR